MDVRLWRSSMDNVDPSAPFDRIVRHMGDFLAARMCSEESFNQVKRNTYKYTDCGAWIDEDEKGITVGSIVEGADYKLPIHDPRILGRIE